MNVYYPFVFNRVETAAGPARTWIRIQAHSMLPSPRYYKNRNRWPYLSINPPILPICGLGHLLLCDVDEIPDNQLQLIRLSRHMRVQNLNKRRQLNKYAANAQDLIKEYVAHAFDRIDKNTRHIRERKHVE
jgi:hypothetical protein